MTAPIRSAFRYFGGKAGLARWIIGHFPPHESYIEPCCGAASVLLQKPPCSLETINDINGDIINFFTVVRNAPDALIGAIHFTLWSRRQFEEAVEGKSPVGLDYGLDPQIERARLFYVRHQMSMHGATDPHPSAWRHRRTGTSPASDIRDIADNFHAIADRLALVQIENRDWEDVVLAYDHPTALTYFDPPYLSSTRIRKDGYSVEWPNADHVSGAEILRGCRGYIVVSGYPSPLYAELYESHGWIRIDREVAANSGATRTECLWLSPRTAEAASIPTMRRLL